MGRSNTLPLMGKSNTLLSMGKPNYLAFPLKVEYLTFPLKGNVFDLPIKSKYIYFPHHLPCKRGVWIYFPLVLPCFGKSVPCIYGLELSKLLANGVSGVVVPKRYFVRPFARGHKPYYYVSVLARLARDLLEDFGSEVHRCKKKH
jgi:hypothetical protein